MSDSVSMSPATPAAGIGTSAQPRPPLAVPWLVALSILISLWLIVLNPVINEAAIPYLVAARVFLEQGYADSFAGFPRPLMPALIALCHQLTGLSLINAGLLLTSLLYILLCLVFVRTVAALGGSGRAQCFAAAVILLQPTLGELRGAILRDPAYWALCLLALQQLIRYCQAPSQRTALYWLAAILTACLFRLEGLLLLAFTPLALLLALPRRQRMIATLRLALPGWIFLGAIVAAGGVSLLSGVDSNLFAAFVAESSGFSGFALDRAPGLLPGQADSAWALLGSSVALLLVQFAREFTLPWLLLLVYGGLRGLTQQLSAPSRIIINSQLLICFLYLILYGFLSQSVPTTAITVLLASLYLPFLLDSLWQARQWRLPARGLAVLVLALPGSALVTPESYRDTLDARAARWLQDHTDTNASVLSNSPRLAWLSEGQVDWGASQPKSVEALLADGDWRNHRYLVLRGSDALKDWYRLGAYSQFDILKVLHGRGGMIVLIAENREYPADRGS